MITTELIPIREQLERIEKKLDGNFKNQFPVAMMIVRFGDV